MARYAHPNGADIGSLKSLEDQKRTADHTSCVETVQDFLVEDRLIS